MDRGVKEVCAI